jgi:hypothetical protein
MPVQIRFASRLASSGRNEGMQRACQVVPRERAAVRALSSEQFLYSSEKKGHDRQPMSDFTRSTSARGSKGFCTKGAPACFIPTTSSLG